MMDRPSGHQAIGPSERRVASALLRALAFASVLLLSYEGLTLIRSVLLPLLANPNALQTDFHYYYDAARRFSADPSRLYLASDDVIAGFAYPPPAIVPFVWLSRLPLGFAFLLMTVASYGAVVAAVELWWPYLRRHAMPVDRRTRLAVLLVVLALGPTYMNAVFGQVNTFVLASAVGFVAAANLAPVFAGAVLAVGLWLKLYPALLVWIGSWDRRARPAVAWAAGGVLLIALASLLMVPAEAYGTYLFNVLPTRGATTAIHISNQSLVAFLERFRYEPELFLNWTGQQAVTIGGAVRAINLGFLGAALAALTHTARRSSSPVPFTAALMALVAIAAPLGWGHTYVMVVPLVITQLVVMHDAKPIVAIVIVACVAALMIPAGRHLPLDWAPAVIQNVVYSRYLLATCLLILTSAIQMGATIKSTPVGSA